MRFSRGRADSVLMTTFFMVQVPSRRISDLRLAPGSAARAFSCTKDQVAEAHRARRPGSCCWAGLVSLGCRGDRCAGEAAARSCRGELEHLADVEVVGVGLVNRDELAH